MTTISELREAKTQIVEQLNRMSLNDPRRRELLAKAQSYANQINALLRG